MRTPKTKSRSLRRRFQVAAVTIAFVVLTILALTLVLTRSAANNPVIVNLGPLLTTVQGQASRTLSSLVIHTTIFDRHSAHRARNDYDTLVDGLTTFRALVADAPIESRAILSEIDAILNNLRDAGTAIAAIERSRLDANLGYNALFGLDEDLTALSKRVTAEQQQQMQNFMDREQRFIVELIVLLVSAIALSGLVVALFWRDFGKLQHSYGKLTERSRQLSLAKKKSEDASAAKSRFLATMSHEMRTPMNGVIGLSQLLLRGNLGENERMFATKIYESASALIQIINEVLDTSAIESGTLRINVRAFEVEKVVQAACGPFEALAHQKGLRLDTAIADQVPAYLHGDDQRIRQILQNLIGNALKFTTKGAINLSLSAPRPGLVCFKVMDTGSGIPEDQIDRVFERFHQVDNSETRNHGGTGLGLAICRELCFLMGGDITLRSQVGKGSVFSVTLPLPSVSPGKPIPEENALPQIPPPPDLESTA